MKLKLRFFTVLLLVAVVRGQAVTVQVDKPGAAIPKTLFGLFFEDINFGADGGLYPERVKNRSFEFPNPMMGWKQLDRGDTKGQLYVYDHGSVNDTPNSHYLRIKSSGVSNEGFRGIGVEKDTWQNRPNGLRSDLVKLLKEMKPGFLRFPGGCIVEGRYLDQRYQWKTTIGDLDERKLIINRWNTEFNWRSTPDYYQSFGLGYYEYFLLSEDIGAEPLPILNCGMACQFNSSELAPLEDLDHYIQDAIDLIEFANAPVNTKWGRKRAEMGHPRPFNLKMIGVGNEQWGPQYVERYEMFAKVLKQKYPKIALVTSAGPSPDGERFEFLWRKMRELNADLLDGSAKNGQSELYASASLDEGAGEVIVKLVNTGSAKRDARITLAGAQRVGPSGKAIVLQSEDLKTENSLDYPTKLAPVEKQLQVSGAEFSYSLLPRSFTVLRIPVR